MRIDTKKMSTEELLDLARLLAESSPEAFKQVARERGMLGGRRPTGKSAAVRQMEAQIRKARARLQILEGLLAERGGDPKAPDCDPSATDVERVRDQRTRLGQRLAGARKGK